MYYLTRFTCQILDPTGREADWKGSDLAENMLGDAMTMNNPGPTERHDRRHRRAPLIVIGLLALLAVAAIVSVFNLTQPSTKPSASSTPTATATPTATTTSATASPTSTEVEETRKPTAAAKISRSCDAAEGEIVQPAQYQHLKGDAKNPVRVKMTCYPEGHGLRLLDESGDYYATTKQNPRFLADGRTVEFIDQAIGAEATKTNEPVTSYVTLYVVSGKQHDCLALIDKGDKVDGLPAGCNVVDKVTVKSTRRMSNKEIFG